MTRVRGHLLIARPIDEVFDFALDQRNEPTYNPAMKRCVTTTQGPIGVGSCFVSEMGSPQRPLVMSSTVTSVVRPTRIASRTLGAGFEVIGGLTFAAVGPRHTRMAWDWDVRPQGWARLAAPLVWLLGRRTERRIWAGLKRVIESSEPRGTPRTERPISRNGGMA